MAVNHLVPGSNPGAGAIFILNSFKNKNGSVKLDLRNGNIPHFLCNKKRTEPEGWFDPAGEHEHFSEAESGRQYQVPEPFLF